VGEDDPYADPDSGVLRNLPEITVATDLARFEADVSAVRLAELERTPIVGGFDLEHLCAIHRRLFGDVYEWAGDLRTVDISKSALFLSCGVPGRTGECDLRRPGTRSR
jgi:cell filamentation protein